MPVRGIDLSPDMVAQLKAKPGADAIAVTIGDFATTAVDGRFRLAYIVYNTIGNLTSQDDQVACFVNAGRHLEPGGCFVVEVAVPPLRRLPPGKRRWPSPSRRTGWASTLSTWSSNWGSPPLPVRRGPCPHVHHALPLRLAGRARSDGADRRPPRERCSGWRREPFNSESASHVSVWEKLAAE